MNEHHIQPLRNGGRELPLSYAPQFLGIAISPTLYFY